MKLSTIHRKSRRSAFFSFAILGILGTGLATPVRAQAAEHDWSGWYMSGVLGSSRTTVDVHFDLPAAFEGPVGSAPQVDSGRLVKRIAPSSLSGRELSGGLAVGYNHPINHWVVGAEAGLVLNGVEAEDHVSGDSIDGPPWSATVDTAVKSNVMLTLRPRIGYSTGKTLVYATGGIALARLKVSQHHSTLLLGSQGGHGLALSETKNKLGWILGAGLERALSPKWSLKAEYLHTNLGKISTSSLSTDEGSWMPAYPVGGETFHHEFKVKTHTINLGVNCKF